MGVRITDNKTVALYDSVTGIAFGEVFEDAYEANAFLNYVREKVAGDIRRPRVYENARFLWDRRYRMVWVAWLEVYGTIEGVEDFDWNRVPETV